MKTLDKYRNTDDLMIEEQQMRVDREEHKKQFKFATASKDTEEGPDNHNFSPSQILEEDAEAQESEVESSQQDQKKPQRYHKNLPML